MYVFVHCGFRRLRGDRTPLQFLSHVGPDYGDKARRYLIDVVHLHVEKKRVDVILARLEGSQLRASVSCAVDEGLTVLEVVMRPGTGMAGVRRRQWLRGHYQL